MSRYARKVDANHAEIVAAFRAHGCEVADTSALGRGFPDLVVLHMGTVRLVEVKDGRKPPSARRLTEAEGAFAARWPVVLVECREDVATHIRMWAQEVRNASVMAGNGPNSNEGRKTHE